ncbi:alpha/beta hydrolase [Flavobacterium magnum]|uniref:Alpha/beta hydrolase n=1 Tax=Flavobacterium magnum TaxID=2162713 RepID=A0A2S0RGE8_9FLAO|nr:alpha/beta fold hydrolase [Flavobacterium magnum]AWA30370.1 alpha/beta hydrolase [Flavobacterium magnum]
MQPLLILHGAIGAKDQFDALVKQLENRFDVHALNFGGHGGAPMPTSFSIQGFATEVADYLTVNNLRSMHIFGYSMGGYVALYLAKEQPQRIAKVFTLATKFHWTPETAAKEIRMLDPEIMLEKVPAFAKILEKRHHPNDWKTVLSETAKMMVAMGDHNPLAPGDFPSISVPVRISIGDKDAMVTPEETLAVYRKLPDASFMVFPETPHPIEKVSVTALAEALDRFFS